MMATGRNMTKNVQLTDQRTKLDDLKRAIQGDDPLNQDVLEDGELESDNDETFAKQFSLSPNENVVEKLIKTDGNSVCPNVQADTSVRMDDDGMDCDVPMKHEFTKYQAESYSKANNDIKNPKAEPSNCYDSSSSSPKEKVTPPYQHVSSLWGDYKIPKKGSSASSTSESRAYSFSQPCSSSNASLLEKCYEDYYTSSSKSRLYYSPQPAASTFKSQMKSTKSSSSTRKYSVSPRPITGGKTIKMAPLKTNQRYKSCKSKTQPNGFPRCELLTDNGIKMIIRFPKKV